MNDEPENLHHDRAEETEPGTQPARGHGGLTAVSIVLACALVAGLAYAWYERGAAQNLALQQDQTMASLSQARSQIDALAAKVNSLSTPPAPVPSTTATAPSTSATGTKRRPHLAEDRRWARLQQQVKAQKERLDTTEQNLQSTQQDLQQARSEMADNLASTRDELDGSIAKTHDELVALEKKGERNYFEFDLSKSKQFQHVGPLSLSLRKANTKHDYFDVAMLVNDFTLNKKHVNLYEPVLIYPSDSKQALELVVNHISKNQVHGYLSAPKYLGSEASTSTSGTAGSSDSSAADSSSESGASAPSSPGTGSSSSSAATGGTDSSPTSKPDANSQEHPDWPH